MSSRKRQYSAIPEMGTVGEFISPISVEGNSDPEKIWYVGLTPWQRLNSHHTYSSVRRNVNFKTFRMSKDHLDLVLTTTYRHDKELFPDPIDIYFQKLTIEPHTKLTKGDVSSLRKSQSYRDYMYNWQYEPQTFKEIKRFVLSKRLYSFHPLVVGGIQERIHPSSVKLMNSSHHSPQTNAGYVRQDRDGMVFYY